MPIISVKRRGQEDQKFKVLLGCLRLEFKAAWKLPINFHSAEELLGEKSYQQSYPRAGPTC